MARFHNYSFGNILAIEPAAPDSYPRCRNPHWNELGRFVKKGEKGIQILAPIVGHRRKKDEQDANRNQKQSPPLC